MATFPYNDATFVLDSLLQEAGLTPSFSAYPHPPPPQGIDCHCALEITNKTPITDKSKTDSSSMVLELHSDGPKETSIEAKRKNSGSSCLSSAQSQDKRGTRTKKQRKCSTRNEEKGEGEFLNKDQKDPPTGYIHVRARRGQATDSHSLAERVRREKISERMKLLQGLVPGSDKVTGKAHMLDEIINYVQSLQYQVEFLSMKLASANPVLHDFGRDVNALMVKPERVSSMIASSPLPSNLSQPTAFADMIPTSTAKHKYSHQNNLLPLLPQQAHMLSAFSQDTGNLPWDVLYDQRQKLLNQYSFNSLC